MRAVVPPQGFKPFSLWVRLALIVIAVALAAAGPAAAVPLSGSLAPGVPFPDRTLVLSVPQAVPVGTGNVHLTENGQPVRALSSAPLAQSGGRLGVVLVIDSDPSMTGAPLAQAMVAARALAGQRTGNQEIGAVFGDGTSLPLTTDAGAIDGFLAHPPRIVPRTNLLASTQQAIAELKAGNVLSGAVIYVSDDIDKAPGLTPQGLAATATAAHVRIFSVAVRDPATTHPSSSDLPLEAMRVLAQNAGGSFSEAGPSQLRTVFAQIESGLASQYVITYRSSVSYGAQVTVSARVDGVAGTVNQTYTAPAAPSFGPAPGTRSRHGFWSSALSAVVSGVVAALLLGLAAALALSHLARSGELRSRVQAFVPADEKRLRQAPSIRRRDTAGLWERLLEGRRWWPDFVEQVDLSSYTRSPQQLVAFAVAGSFLAAVLAELVTGSPLLALLLLPSGPMVLRSLVRRNVRKQRLLFMEQLPGQLHEMASAMRTGRSMTEALGVVIESAEEPIRREFERVVADERAGLTIEDALRPVSARMDSTEVEQVAIVAALHRRTGANITEVLDRVADTARQRVEIRRELLALTAQARLSRSVLTALPVVVVIAIDLIGGDYERPLFHTRPGLILMIVAAGMVLLGSRIMKTIVNIEE